LIAIRSADAHVDPGLATCRRQPSLPKDLLAAEALLKPRDLLFTRYSGNPTPRTLLPELIDLERTGSDQEAFGWTDRCSLREHGRRVPEQSNPTNTNRSGERRRAS
jgi:hypothetical protein